jgi:tetratricopeptide (TPR) repeat protein
MYKIKEAEEYVRKANKALNETLFLFHRPNYKKAGKLFYNSSCFYKIQSNIDQDIDEYKLNAAINFNKSGDCYMNCKKYQDYIYCKNEAIKFYKCIDNNKCIEILLELISYYQNNNDNNIIYYYEKIAEIYYSDMNYLESIKYYKLSVSNYKSNQKLYKIINCYLKLKDYYNTKDILEEICINSFNKKHYLNLLICYYILDDLVDKIKFL